MPSDTVSSAQFQKAFGRYREVALRTPVVITNHGRESLVLMSAEEYRRLQRGAPRALRPREMAEDDIAALEAPLPPGEGAAFDHEWTP